MQVTHNITLPVLPEKPKVAIVGVGYLFQIVRPAFDSSRTPLVGACDPQPDRTRELATEGIPCHTSVSQLLSHCSFDIAWVAVPNTKHFEVSQELLCAGKIVMLEKPAVYDPDLFERLIKESHGRLYLCTHAAFGAEILHFLQHRATIEHELGSLRKVDQLFSDPIIGSATEERNFASLNGSWLDSGINAISVLRLITSSRVQSHHAQFFTLPDGKREIGSLIGIHFESGVTANIRTTWNEQRNHKNTTLYYEHGSVQLDHSAQQIIKVVGNSEPQTIFDGSQAGARLVVHYRNCIEDLFRTFSSVANYRAHLQFARSVYNIYFKVNEAHPFFD